MKIGVISTPVFKIPVSGYSGLEHLAWQQAKGLAALGHEVTVFAPDGSHCPGCNVFHFGPERTWDERKAYERYWSVLPSMDVVIDSTWNKWSYILKQEGVLKAPVLGVMHAPVNTMFQSVPPVDKPCVVCISKDQASHFEALFSKPVRVVYNGIDLNFYQPTGVPRTDRFLFLARFSSIKGADLAIEACLKVGVGLDLVGDTSITNEPDYFARCKAMAEQSTPNWDHSKGKQIRIVGPATRGECVHWFSQAHALLHPNQRFREPFGLAPVESLACGCPVIAWNFGAMRETVKHGETGYLVNSMDELVTAVGAVCYKNNLGEYKLPQELRTRCRQWASQFSEENMVKGYESLCREAIEGGW